jgi:hypothetical protein
MRIVICCGADRTGKSTLVGEFEKAGWLPKHFNPPKKSPYEEYREYADWLMSEGDPNGKYIIDRYMYCEFAYSKHYGRSTDMTIERMNEIEDMLLKLDPRAVVVYCETDLESNWARINDEGKKEFRSIEQLEALREEYKRVLLKSKLDLVEYDFTAGDTPAGTVSEIESA